MARVPSPRQRRFTLLAAIAAVIVGGFAVTLWLQHQGISPQETNDASIDPNRVVVDGFENRTGDPALESMGMQLAETIEGVVRGIDAMTLASNPYRSMSDTGQPSARKETNDPIRTLAEKTRSGLLVAGSYYLVTDQIEIQARIENPWDGEVLVAFEPVRGPLSESGDAIFAVSDAVAGALAAHADNVIPLGTEHSPTLSAYNEYQLGMSTDLGGPAAVSHFERALEIDPDFNLARGLLCWIYRSISQYHRAESLLAELDADPAAKNHARACRAALEGRRLDVLTMCRSYVQRAPNAHWIRANLGATAISVNRPREAAAALEEIPIDWDTAQGRGHTSLLLLGAAYHMLGDYEAELRIADDALAHFPDVSFFYGQQGDALAALGRLEEINRLADNCFSIPARVGTAGTTLRITAEELRAHGSRESSLQLAERVLEWYSGRPDQTSRRHRAGLAKVLVVAERFPEALEIVKALARDDPERIEYQGWLGVLAARTGDRSTAERIFEGLISIDRPYTYGKASYARACIAANLGDPELAVRLLRDAFSQGFPFSVSIHRDMNLEPLWDYGPFKEILEPKG